MNTDQMSDSDIDQTLRDSLQSGQEIQIRDNSGKVTLYNNQRTENKLDLSELELANNLSSSTEIEKDVEHLENTNLRRSKRLTKTTPIVRLNNPVNQIDYRKHIKKAQPVTTPGVHGRNTWTGQRGRPINRPSHSIHPQPDTQKASHGTPEKTTPDHGRITEHNIKKDSNGNSLDDPPPITEGGMENISNCINRLFINNIISLLLFFVCLLTTTDFIL